VRQPSASAVRAALLSFNGGFVDAAGYLGLQGLFTAHVTGNFVTLGATLVFGTHGAFAKLLTLPEFVAVVALTQLAGIMLAERRLPALRILLAAKVMLLLAFFALAAALGPFPDSDAPAALLTGLAGVSAMAVQNAVQRMYLPNTPPGTIMTGNTSQAVLDAVNLLRGADPEHAAVMHARFGRILRAILCFAAGCAGAPLLYAWIGLWNLAVPVVVGAASALLRAEEGEGRAGARGRTV
jgi:uncharacterized membrane protein YoaK (UPF0700 family)